MGRRKSGASREYDTIDTRFSVTLNAMSNALALKQKQEKMKRETKDNIREAVRDTINIEEVIRGFEEGMRIKVEDEEGGSEHMEVIPEADENERYSDMDDEDHIDSIEELKMGSGNQETSAEGVMPTPLPPSRFKLGDFDLGIIPLPGYVTSSPPPPLPPPRFLFDIPRGPKTSSINLILNNSPLPRRYPLQGNVRSLGTEPPFHSTVHDSFRSDTGVFDKGMLSKLDSPRRTHMATYVEPYRRQLPERSFNEPMHSSKLHRYTTPEAPFHLVYDEEPAI